MVDAMIPKTIDEALIALDKEPYTIISGGTDLMVQNRIWSGLPSPFKHPLLFVFNIEELSYVRKEATIVRIGASTDLETVMHHKDTPELLKTMIQDIASPGIRHTATIAGNIANASPAADTLLVLYLLDAKVVIRSYKATRTVPIETFIKGVKHHDLKSNELITEIILDNQTFTHVTVKKVGTRKADAISKIGFIGVANIEDDHIKDIRITLNAVAKTVIRDRDAETFLRGISRRVVDQKRDAFVAYYDTHISPITDQRSNKTYRKHVSLNLIHDFLNRLR
ncbi:MAG: FAD binding domain-containing protein [Bacillota bacterium]